MFLAMMQPPYTGIVTEEWMILMQGYSSGSTENRTAQDRFGSTLTCLTEMLFEAQLTRTRIRERKRL